MDAEPPPDELSALDELSEVDLVHLARLGDRDAFRDLIESHQIRGYRLAWFLTGNQADAEDALQTAIMQVWRRMQTLRSGRAFGAWFLQIVANAAKNIRRQNTAVERLRLRLTYEPQVAHLPSAEALTLTNDTRHRLLEAVTSLPDHERDAVLCRFFLGMSQRECATVLGLREGTVKSRVSRAVSRLRKVISAE
jgi:RNA polymerase sigma factor (sigma-70 family)